MVDGADRPRLNPEIALERVAGRLMAAGNSDVLHLFEEPTGERSEVGERIVELCNGTRSVSEVVSALCDEFEVDADTCRADTMAFVELLISRQILTLDATPSRARR